MIEKISALRAAKEMGIFHADMQRSLDPFLSQNTHDIESHELGVMPGVPRLETRSKPFLRINVEPSTLDEFDSLAQALYCQAFADPGIAPLVRGDKGSPLVIIVAPAT